MLGATAAAAAAPAACLESDYASCTCARVSKSEKDEQPDMACRGYTAKRRRQERGG